VAAIEGVAVIKKELVVEMEEIEALPGIEEIEAPVGAGRVPHMFSEA
jgi:hypothetical protein